MLVRKTSFLGAALFAVLSTTACSSDTATSPISTDQPAGLPLIAGSGGGSTNTGGGSTSTGGGGTKTACTNTLQLSGTASEALSGNTFSVAYVLNSCQSKTRVSMTATDLATGQVVWASIPDLAGTVAIWSLPYRLTSYRVDARAVAGSTNTLVATASTVLSTLTPLACDRFVNETVTTGYYLTYAAVWAATDVQDCGAGGTVHLQITNLNTGLVELDYPSIGMSSMIDFEGPVVSYSTPYRVYAELRSPAGDLLASSTKDVISSPIR